MLFNLVVIIKMCMECIPRHPHILNMVLLHVEAKATSTATNKYRVNLTHHIPAQVMTLKKSVVAITHNASGENPNHVVYIRAPFLTNYEITSTNDSGLLPVSFDPKANRTAATYDIKFKVEDVSQQFDLEFFKDESGTAFNLQTGVNNTLTSVHLWFEYSTNQNFI